MMENYTPKLIIHKVLWELPMEGWLKVNTDGASRGNPGRSSIGFCIRNEIGDVMYVRGMEIQETTNTCAEAMAILEALRYCSRYSIHRLWLQTDSLMLKSVIDGIWKPPWMIAEFVEEIRKMVESSNATISTHLWGRE